VTERTAEAVVKVSHHILLLQDEEAVPEVPALPPTNGHCQAIPGAILVFCGIHTGPVHVNVDVRAQAPYTQTLEGWDEVTEIDLRPVSGSARVAVLFRSVPEALSKLTDGQASSWRVRVQSRGRDRSDESSASAPLEEHEFILWPASSPAETASLKHTDAYGGALRSVQPVRSSRPSVASDASAVPDDRPQPTSGGPVTPNASGYLPPSDSAET
jgi:hypothetical protein